jgi:hypothetical protein
MIDWAAITAAIGSIATVVGSFGGYLLAGHNEEKRDERVTAREAETRKAALGERLEEERHNFQRDTFRALQDQLLELARQHAHPAQPARSPPRHQRPQLPVADPHRVPRLTHPAPPSHCRNAGWHALDLAACLRPR